MEHGIWDYFFMLVYDRQNLLTIHLVSTRISSSRVNVQLLFHVMILKLDLWLNAHAHLYVVIPERQKITDSLAGALIDYLCWALVRLKIIIHFHPYYTSVI